MLVRSNLPRLWLSLVMASSPLVCLDGDSGLVIAVGGEGLRGGDGSVPLGQGGHHTSDQDGGLDSGSFVRVDELVQLLAVGEVLEQLLDLGNPSGTTVLDDVVDRAFAHLSVSRGLQPGLKGALEQVGAEFLEPGPGDGGVKLIPLKSKAISMLA